MTSLEVCVAADELDTLAAQLRAVAEGGAQRVELCAAMAQEGLTPSAEAIKLARQSLTKELELLVMLRPRGGDFCYSAAELQQFEQGLVWAASCGADGVVLGCLTSDGRIDRPALAPLLARARQAGLKVTFHRAFDVLVEPLQGLTELIDLQVDRVLTSGTPWLSGKGALEGVGRINEYLQLADGRIEVVVGGGVSLDNLGVLCQQLAGPARRLSFHCHSALLSEYQVDRAKVSQAVALLA